MASSAPPGQAPTWGRHIPARHGYQGATQVGLITATQSTPRNVLGRYGKGVTSPGVSLAPIRAAGFMALSQVPPCFLLLSILAIQLLIVSARS